MLACLIYATLLVECWRKQIREPYFKPEETDLKVSSLNFSVTNFELKTGAPETTRK